MRTRVRGIVVAAVTGAALLAGAGVASASPHNDRGFTTDGGPMCGGGWDTVVLAESTQSKIAICRNEGRGGQLMYIGYGKHSGAWLNTEDVRVDGASYLVTNAKHTYVVTWGMLEIDDPYGNDVSNEPLEMYVFEHD